MKRSPRPSNRRLSPRPPTEVAPAEIEELLFALVRTPSHEQIAGCEAVLVERLRDYLEAEHVDVELHDVIGGRRNLIARLEGSDTGSSLLLNAHSDTVPGYG